MEETPWAVPSQEMYLVSGMTNEQFDIRGLRDRIRAGQLAPEQEISVVGTDVWKPASQYPVLTRYFQLAQKMSASPMVQPSRAAVSNPSAPGRLVPGFVYPFTSITAILFMVAAFATALNVLISAPISLFATVFSLAIIRSSSEGKTRAPEAGAVGGIGTWILDALRVVAITLISAWPIIAALLLFVLFHSIAIVFVAMIVMLLYYPACLIAIARWKSLSMALSIKAIFGLISALGSEYYGAVAMFIALLIASSVGIGLATPMVGVRAAKGLNAVAAIFTTFYVAHLLGWAVYRHAAEVE